MARAVWNGTSSRVHHSAHAVFDVARPVTGPEALHRRRAWGPVTRAAATASKSSAIRAQTSRPASPLRTIQTGSAILYPNHALMPRPNCVQAQL
jgi:hypothetical protein